MTDSPEPPVASPPNSTATISINDLHRLSRKQLAARAEELAIRVRVDGSVHQMVMDQIRHHLTEGDRVEAEGILEFDSNRRGTLRWPQFHFLPCPEDVLVPAALLEPPRLQAGQLLRVLVRDPQRREQGLVAEAILAIEGVPAAEWEPTVDFDKLTALFPDRRILLEAPGSPEISPRAVDLIAPLGMGQRGLIVAPPRVGKTILLKELARAIRRAEPEIHLMLLLVDERPEEVTDFQRELDCDIFASTFDESPARHVQVAELVSERAKRLVEMRKDVVILLDSITRLSRGYNNLMPGGKKGRTMSGGIDAKALARPKKFFGAARNVEEGGSLTILATALVDTHSRMDDLIFEEYKGTGNMEIHLDRSVAEQRVFPALHVTKSATRREELLYHPDELDRVIAIRKQLAELPAVEAMEVFQTNLMNTATNAELLLSGLRGT